MGVAVSAFTSMTQFTRKQQTQGNARFSADQTRRNIIQHLNNNAAWQKMVTDTTNATFACLRDSTSYTGESGPFKVRKL